MFPFIIIFFIFSNLNDELISYSKNKEKILKDLPKFQKVLEDIIEFLLSKENEDENFLSFCENNMIETIINITALQERSINLIIIKSFGILIPSLKNNKIMFYLFSKNYMNQIITNISYNKEDNDIDYLSFYINFLKTLANKLDKSSFALFFNQSHNKFPLLDEIIIYFTYDQDVMIKNTSRNIFLTLLKLNYGPFIEYICDLPTITLFLLFADNLKNHMKFFCQNKENNINNNNYLDKIKESEEREEIIIDDISFIQDILSINIPKINYLLINTIFYLPIAYLFNNILTKLNANISYYILRIFLEILQNETIKNIITFILYSSHIQIKIIEIVANEETVDIYRLLKLNKYLFHSNINNIKSIIHHNLNILSFDDYIVLNYSKKFLNSLRYTKETDNTYIELKEISNYLNKYENKDNDIKYSIKFLNKKVNKINYVIKQIENYHGFISRATGINCGAIDNAANGCLLQIIYNNLIAYKDNNIIKNKYLQENIFKNECIYYLNNFHLSQYICTVNELFLINEIINNNDISEILKQNLYLLKNSLNKVKNEITNNTFININSIDETDITNSPNEKNESYSNSNLSQKNEIICQTLDTPPAPGALEPNKNDDFNNNNSLNIQNVNFSAFQPKNNHLYNQFFDKEINIENYKKFSNHNSVSLSLPNPIDNSINVNQFNNNINLIVDNKIMKYSDMIFNNDFFHKILIDYKASNDLNIVEAIINLVIDGKKILNKIIYKLSIIILEDLLIDSIIFWPMKRKYQYKINEHYKHILQMINDFLNKNTLIEQNNNKYIYEFFEQCFIFNTKDINKDIKNNIFKFTILLTNPLKEEENIYKEYKDQMDLIKIPEEKYQIIKCLFQKMLSLYDLKYIINNFNNTKKSELIKNKAFPLYFLDLDKFKIHCKINLNKLSIEYYKLKFKLEQEELYNDGALFINQNYFFICLPYIDNKIIQNKEIKVEGDQNNNETFMTTIENNTTKTDIISYSNNNLDDDDFFIIKHRFPLRNIEVILNDNKENKIDKNKIKKTEDSESEGEKLTLFINNETKIYLSFENKLNNVKIENIIKDNTQCSRLLLQVLQSLFCLFN